jgi:hypothetical protein
MTQDSRYPSHRISEVKTKTLAATATSATRMEALDPTSGTAVRIISVEVAAKVTTAPDKVGVYFHTGATYLTTAAKAICEGHVGTTGGFFRSWPDGAGPIGATDEVVSWIAETETETGIDLTLVYREEHIAS